MRLRVFVMVGILSVASALVSAGPILWVSDQNARLGTIDVATGAVLTNVNMGITMTDIAFDPNGNLYGISFNSLYSIDKTTGLTSFIGAHGINGGNALVFSASGTLYGAGANQTLYTLNTSTGAATALAGSTGGNSSGDLAFNGGELYLSTTSNTLRNIEFAPPPVTSTLVGGLGVSNMFGLATAGDGVLYGVAGLGVYSVNTTTGAATFLNSYGAQGLSVAFGSAFFEEAGADPIPEPGTLLLLRPVSRR